MLAAAEPGDRPYFAAPDADVAQQMVREFAQPGPVPADAHDARHELGRDADVLASLWIGNRGRTAAHWDLPQNLACVIKGRRRFTLLPPEQVKNIYVGPLDFTLAGQPSSLVNFRAPDFEAFPRFRDAIANAQIAELGPGDALYLAPDQRVRIW